MQATRKGVIVARVVLCALFAMASVVLPFTRPAIVSALCLSAAVSFRCNAP